MFALEYTASIHEEIPLSLLSIFFDSVDSIFLYNQIKLEIQTADQYNNNTDGSQLND